MVFKSPFDYADPFGDTTAPAAPVAQKPVRGNVGISPITMQGAVSIPAESTIASPVANKYLSQKDIDKLTNDMSMFSSLVFPQATPPASSALPLTESDIASYKTYDLNNLPSELSNMTAAELEKLYRQQDSSYQILPSINWGFGGGTSYKTADTGYDFNDITLAWNQKLIEEGRLAPVTDVTGEYSAIPLAKKPSQGFGGLQGNFIAGQPLELLNSDTPEEGGLDAAREELLAYASRKDIGGGNAADYDYNLGVAASAIGGKYGVFGTQGSRPSDILPQGGNTASQLKRVEDAFAGVANTAEGIKNYTGLENYTPANYTDGKFAKAEKYTGMSDAKFNEMYSLIKPIADEYLFTSTLNGTGVTQAREMFLQDPMIASVMDAYGMKQTRSTDDGSLYTWDPFTNREIRLVEKEYSLGKDLVKGALLVGTTIATMGNPVAASLVQTARTLQAGGDFEDVAKAAIGAYVGNQAATNGGMFSGVGQALSPNNAALASGISAGVASGVSTAVQGGDLGDVVKSGLLGGAGGYVSGLGTEAASLEQAAQAAGAAGDFSSSIALTMQANQLTQQAGLIGTVANSAKALDAAASGDYVTALASGLNAAGTDLTKFTSDKITGLFGEEALVNLNVDDIAAGVNKVATSLLDGKDFDDALQAGVKEYVQKGGSLGGAGDKIKDYLTAAGEGLYNDILKPAGDFLTGLVDNVQSFDTPDGIKAIEDAARTAGSAIDDAVLQPIREGLKDIDLPDVDVDLDFPSFDVGSFLMEGLQPSQTAGRELLDPVYADLSNRRLAPVSQEELFAEPDYLQKLLRTL